MRPLMKCGCVGAVDRVFEDGRREPWCLTHDCGEVAAAPDLSTRRARCHYFGTKVKHGWYNSNCCDKCAASPDDICHCEEPSSLDLWFFVHRPDQPFDEFYCACHGAD